MSDEDRKEAEDRIARIRGGGQGAPAGGRDDVSDDYDDYDDSTSDALSRARSRADPLRGPSRGGSRAERSQPAAPPPGRTAARRGPNAIVVVGGVVGLGLIIVLAILLVGQLAGGSSILPLGPTETPTPTATPTPVPPTETPTATPTPDIPPLYAPPLTCIFQSGIGCFDYCNDAENAGECEAAADFLEAQGVDAEQFFICLGTEPGANIGTTLVCLDEGWLA
ncbi:MAG: hypothetical protein ACFB51_04320, partial [Anaerolineae bacterium]